MNQKTITILAAVIDTQQLTVYLISGEQLVIPQGDPRVRQIIDQATPQLITNGVATVTFDEPTNTYQEFEKTSSIVKFFKVAKQHIASFFGSTFVEPQTIGDPSKEVVSMQAAIEDVMKHAVPASTFTEANVSTQRAIVGDSNSVTSSQLETLDNAATHTIIATIDNKVVAGVEKIKSQFDSASKRGSTIGVENFLRRVAAISQNRKHSVDDLLKFMERGDLPIADDGSIVIYKVLRKRGDHYVDCHTKLVKQKLGSYVHMDASMVDSNRHNECSNGLHVARRQYISNFAGDACVIAKVAPEAVIAVPAYDANKMRVRGYHILYELGKAEYDLLRNNKAITETTIGRELLGKVIAGVHPEVTSDVHIKGNLGTNVVFTSLETSDDTPQTTVVPAPVEAIVDNTADSLAAAVVQPLAVNAMVAAAVLSRKEQAQAIFISFTSAAKADKLAYAKEIYAIKKASKKSWGNLGISDADGQTIQDLVS